MAAIATYRRTSSGMKARPPRSNAAPATASERIAKGLSLVALVLLVNLSPALTPAVFAAIVVLTTVVVIAVYPKKDFLALFGTEYLVLLAYLAAFLAMSEAHLWRFPDFIYSRDAIVPQVAGLLLIMIAMPAFVRIGGWLLNGRIGLPSLTMTAIVTIAVTAYLRPAEEIFTVNGVYGVLTPALWAHFVYFLVIQRAPQRWMRIALALIPLPLLAASSNILIELGFAMIFFAEGRRYAIYALAAVLLVFVALVANQAAPVRFLLESDPNTLARSRLWWYGLHAIADHPLGIGYGNSYTSTAAFSDAYIRNVYQQIPGLALFTANHNSLIDTVLRMTAVGAVIVGALFWNNWRKVGGVRMRESASAALAIVLVSTLINPAIETARCAIFIAIALGYIRAAALAERNTGFAEVADREPRIAISPAERRARLAALAST